MGSQSVKDNVKKEESKGPVPVTYNTNLERLLKENSEECESLSILHRMSYEKYNTRSNYINIPVIILSSAIGFITGIDLQYDKMNIILGVGSVFVGIIKSVDTYFQLAKRAESHRICSLQFSQISKKMQVELTLHRNQRMTAENMMNIIKTDIKNMQDIAPLIDDDIINIYNAKYRKYKRVKKPNFVNGLTDVVVNSNNNEYEYEYSSRHGSREGSPANAQVAPQTSQSHDKEYEHQLESQGVNNTSVSKMNDATVNSSNHVDDDNESVEPIQPTIIPTTRSNESLKLGSVSGINSIRKAAVAGAELSVPVMAVADTGRELLQQQQQQNPLELLQILSKIQQGIASNVVGSNLPPQLSHPSQSPQPHAVAVETNDVIIPIDIDVDVVPSVSPSPSGSIRSNSSLPLGSIQTDNSGNQIVNT